eukprot:jgi/Tetstr1/441818/TSEL_030034.t1
MAQRPALGAGVRGDGGWGVVEPGRRGVRGMLAICWVGSLRTSVRIRLLEGLRVRSADTTWEKYFTLVAVEIQRLPLGRDEHQYMRISDAMAQGAQVKLADIQQQQAVHVICGPLFGSRTAGIHGNTGTGGRAGFRIKR